MKVFSAKKDISFSLRIPMYSPEFIPVLGKAKSSIASLQKAPHTSMEPPPKFFLEKYRGFFRRSLQYPLKPSGQAHKSRQTMEWLKSNNIKVSDWPACSPVQNPIENILGNIGPPRLCPK